jgi:hypothetical protein
MSPASVLPPSALVTGDPASLPYISVSVMALHRQDAEADTDIAYVLSEHACEPLGSEIERIESILASCPRRRRQQEVRA